MTKEKASYFGVCGMKVKKNQNVFVRLAGYLLKKKAEENYLSQMDTIQKYMT